MIAIVMGVLLSAQEEAKPPQEPQEIKIYGASIKPGDLFFTPWSADVVTSSDSARRQSRSVPDGLREVPGVYVQRTSNGQGSPAIRGFMGFRNVMLVDGIRLNNSTFREGPNQYWSTVDSYLLDRMEIIRGPSSVLYGSDSLGGTVYAYTKEPASLGGAMSRSIYRFAGAERSHTVRQETGQEGGTFGWIAGATWRDFNDMVGGRHVGLMPETGFDEYDADAKVVYKLGKNEKLVFAFQHTRQDDVPRTHSTVHSKSWHGTAVDTGAASLRKRDYDQERNLAYAQYHATFEGGLVDALKASLSWQRQAERELFIYTRTAPGTVAKKEVRDFEVDSPAFWVQAGKQTGAGYFTGGAEFYRDIVGSGGHDWLVNGNLRTFNRGTIADDATYDMFGLYLQDEFSIGELQVTPGIRYSRIAAEADEVDPDPADAYVFSPLHETYSAVTGSLRLLYPLNEQWNLIGGWGMGFRAPSLDDSTAIKLTMSGTIDLPAENLDPERTHTFDLGVRAKYPAWRFSAFAFYSQLDDFLQRVPAGTYGTPPLAARTKVNFSEGYMYGFEVGGAWRPAETIEVFADWGYAKGEADQFVGAVASEQPLTKVNPSTAHLGLRYEPKESRAWAEALATAVRHQHHLSASSDVTDVQRIPVASGGTPGYTVYTVRGGYELCKNATLTAAVENVTNKDYRHHGSGQNEPGTNFILGLEVRY